MNIIPLHDTTEVKQIRRKRRQEKMTFLLEMSQTEDANELARLQKLYESTFHEKLSKGIEKRRWQRHAL